MCGSPGLPFLSGYSTFGFIWFSLYFLKFHCVKSSKYGIFSGSCSARVPGNTNQKKLCTPHEIRTRKNSRRVWLTGLIRMSEKCSLRNLFSIGFQGQSHRFSCEFRQFLLKWCYVNSKGKRMTDHRILRFFKQGVILFCQNRLETKKNVRLK